jgi:hypothetical protein
MYCDFLNFELLEIWHHHIQSLEQELYTVEFNTENTAWVGEQTTCTFKSTYSYIPVQSIPKSDRKCCVKIQTTPSVRTGFPAVIQHSLLKHLKCLKSKTWNDLTLANLLFLERKTGSAIIGLLVSLQDAMVFSSSPTLQSLVRVNPPIPTQFWCRNQKIRGKRRLSLKSTEKWKSQIIDGVWWIMISISEPWCSKFV